MVIIVSQKWLIAPFSFFVVVVVVVKIFKLVSINNCRQYSLFLIDIQPTISFEKKTLWDHSDKKKTKNKARRSTQDLRSGTKVTETCRLKFKKKTRKTTAMTNNGIKNFFFLVLLSFGFVSIFGFRLKLVIKQKTKTKKIMTNDFWIAQLLGGVIENDHNMAIIIIKLITRSSMISNDDFYSNDDSRWWWWSTNGHTHQIIIINNLGQDQRKNDRFLQNDTNFVF